MKNEEVYRLLAENMQDIVSQHSVDGIILWISPSVTQLLGYTQEELIDTSFYDLLEEDDRAYMVNYAHDLTLSNSYNENIRIEYRIRRKTGEYVWYESLTKPITNHEEKVITLQVTSRNIAKRKKTEEALNYSKERLELALDGADLGLWDLNLQTGELVVNDRWASMLGYETWELEPTMKGWARLVHPEDFPKVSQMLNEHLLEQSMVYESEHRLKRKDGGYTWILSKGKVLEWDEEGKPFRAVGTHLDINNSKKIEVAVMKAIVETQEKERKRFAADLHDGIGQYLSAISMHLDVIDDVLDKRQDATVGAMMNIVNDHINHTLDGIREIVHNLMPGSLEDLGLVPALEELFQRILERLSIDISFEHEGIAEDERFHSNLEVAVYRISQQLLSNTMQHAQATAITVKLVKRGGQLRLVFADNGIGMGQDRNRMEQGSGIRNMASRIKSVQGSIRFLNNKPGLKVMITVPIEEEAP